MAEKDERPVSLEQSVEDNLASVRRTLAQIDSLNDKWKVSILYTISIDTCRTLNLVRC